MNGCGTELGNVVVRTRCILTYGGSNNNVLDIAINYTVLVLNVAACAWFCRRHNNTSNNDCTSTRLAPLISLILVVLYQIGLCLGLACSGISIVWCACLGWYYHKTRCYYPKKKCNTNLSNNNDVDCDSNNKISSSKHQILSSLREDREGVVVAEGRQEATAPTRTHTLIVRRCHRIELALGLLNLSILLYYFFTTEIITTVAHLCALFLGMLLSVLENVMLATMMMIFGGTQQQELRAQMNHGMESNRDNNDGAGSGPAPAGGIEAMPRESSFSSFSRGEGTTSVWFTLCYQVRQDELFQNHFQFVNFISQVDVLTFSAVLYGQSGDKNPSSLTNKRMHPFHKNCTPSIPKQF